MSDQEAEDFKMAIRLSTEQHESPEPKRSKAGGSSDVGGNRQLPEESPEAKNRRIQRDLFAAAAERRISSARNAFATVEVEKSAPATAVENVENFKDVQAVGVEGDTKGKNVEKVEGGRRFSGTSLLTSEADRLFRLIFGDGVSEAVLAQWCNQGIRFSADPDTSMGLVQHEGGPCGVLAAIQAFVLKYLLFIPEHSENIGKAAMHLNESVNADAFPPLSEEKRSRALVRSMSEMLFSCGRSNRAVIAYLDILNCDYSKSASGSEDEPIAKALEGVSVESGSDLQKILIVEKCTSQSVVLQKLEAMLPIFRSRLGVLLFLISTLLSRGLDCIQGDRDDPSLPLVTTPFGHASQEIVNLLLSGSAVANVFDGSMDLGEGMFVKGISTSVEVGFLTLLEALNLCKVGQYLKCPKWPIWVVGSESHYTVLFALDPKVQDENEYETRESEIRRSFDARDQSGGGGFISVEGFDQVLKEMSIQLPGEKVQLLTNTGFVVWSEFWQVLTEVDKSCGGVKDSSGTQGKKVFNIYHFNGIAKSVAQSVQRPRLTKLRVSVPPRWTPEEYMASKPETQSEASRSPPPQQAPLADCIRTRWPRAACYWEGDAPSIV